MQIYPKGKISLLLLAALITLALSQTADDDEVNTSIPGYPFKIYSGYLPLNVIEDKNIHYVFFPSQNNPSSDPLLVWFAGAPGCSSLLACFHENGPFVFEPGKSTFTRNPNSWNKNANLLFFELPGAVGFSKGPLDQIITDQIFTKDAMYTFRQFFNRFAPYKKNDMYLSGHGYGAVHVAYLAKQILEQNNDPYTIFNDRFNLKGILVGNACVRPDECYATGSQKLSYYHYEFLYNRAYFTKKAWGDFRSSCLINYDGFNCFNERKKLDTLFNATNSSMYNIYDKCYKTKNTTGLKYVNSGCEDNAGLMTYLNDANVKRNWNVDADKEWTPCNTKIFEEYRNANNSYWIYPYLIQNKLKIWVYSGDIDSFVPVIGTKRWVEELRHTLNMPVKRIWREWWVPGRHKGEDQVGGFIWELRDITFVTVKAAGFRAAWDQPEAMSELLNGFIAGKTLPYKNT